MAKLLHSSSLKSKGNGGAGGLAVRTATAHTKLDLDAIAKRARQAVIKDKRTRAKINDPQILKTLDSFGK